MTVEIVDRERELRLLRSTAENAPALIVLRGRRRVGKSFLLRVALSATPRLISYQAEEEPRVLQLESFAAECARLVPGAPQLQFATWRDALAFLEAQARSSGPLVVVMDEFQRVAAQDKSIESVIQNAWDRWDQEHAPIVLVLSGSALGFMAGLLQGDKPTYGRSAYRPLLLPLSYRDVTPFGPQGATAVERLERYSVLGGTPQYQRWAGKRSLSAVIEDVILSPDAPLYDDPEHLIRAEDGVREPGPYFGVLEAIARGLTSPTTIGGRIGVSAQLVTNYLNRLEVLGYIARVEPLEPRSAGRVRAYWKISDPYFAFWFANVFPNRSRLSRGRIKEVAAEIKKQLPQIVSFVFEDCCREWVASHSDLGADATEVGSWWTRKSDTEIDVVALNNKGYTLLGSCKWLTRPVGTKPLDDLYHARATLGPKAAQAQLAIFSKNGFAEDLERRAAGEGVHLVDVSDLYP